MEKFVILLVLLIALNIAAAEEDTVKIKFFYTDDCDHCAITKEYLNELKPEYGKKLDIQMVDVFSTGGYKEFKDNGFVMTPSLVFNEQIKIEGDTTKETLIHTIDYFLNRKKCVVRFFYDKKEQSTEHERITRILSELDTENVSILCLDPGINRNSFLYFGFSKTPAVAVNEISIEENITENVINSTVNFCLEEKGIKIIGFYSDIKEKEEIDSIISSGRYTDRVSMLWIDTTKHTQEFYLNGFSETPAVIIDDDTKISEVTREKLVKALENTDPSFYTPLQIYFVLHPSLKCFIIFGLFCSVAGVLLWRR
ncbi:MAG: thioredoxin family protein [Euryarchaeota archaeon]|nr:thioredoxin family protein [Euryarchaeota archaeon]